MIKHQKAIVLGGTRPHIHLLELLKARGFSTLLLDYFENPIASGYADQHIQASTLDRERVLQIAKEQRVSLIISTCVDQANATACYVATELGLPCPYSPETAFKVTNKPMMKQIMNQHDIPTAKFLNIKTLSDCHGHNLKYPLIVKPADSNGSKGVRRVETEQELFHFGKLALEISRSGEAVVEEFIEGSEVGIDCFIVAGKASIICSRERRKIDCSGDVQQIYGSVWPADAVNQNRDQIVAVAEKIAMAFELDNTPLMIQGIISQSHFHVIEFAPRVGGGDNFRIIPKMTGFDIVDATIDSFLGNSVKIEFSNPNLYFFDNYLYCHPGVFSHINGLEKLEEAGQIDYWDIYKPAGVQLPEGLASNNRVGLFVVSGSNRQELANKVLQSVEKIEVYDQAGGSIFRKDIYQSFQLEDHLPSSRLTEY